jgi:hypothetical protein
MPEHRSAATKSSSARPIASTVVAIQRFFVLGTFLSPVLYVVVLLVLQ